MVPDRGLRIGCLTLRFGTEFIGVVGDGCEEETASWKRCQLPPIECCTACAEMRPAAVVASAPELAKKHFAPILRQRAGPCRTRELQGHARRLRAVSLAM